MIKLWPDVVKRKIQDVERQQYNMECFKSNVLCNFVSQYKPDCLLNNTTLKT